MNGSPGIVLKKKHKRMSANKTQKVIGASLIGLAILSDSKQVRVALGIAATAVLFPQQTAKVVDVIRRESIASNKRSTQAEPSQLRTIQVSGYESGKGAQVGLIRSFAKKSKACIVSFCKWIW